MTWAGRSRPRSLALSVSAKVCCTQRLLHPGKSRSRANPADFADLREVRRERPGDQGEAGVVLTQTPAGTRHRCRSQQKPKPARLLSGSGVVIRVVPLAGIWCDG